MRTDPFRAAVLGAYFLFLPPLLAQATGMEAFRDSFESLDGNRWFISDGWANGEHQNCTFSASNAMAENGILRLILSDTAAGDRDYSCAEIQSHERAGYGAYEISMKVQFASGTNANFFSFIGAPQNQPHDEIDLEFIGRAAGSLQTNYFREGKGGNEEVIRLPEAKSDFNQYSFIWEPHRIRWFMNKRLLRQVNSSNIPQVPQKIFLSLWSTDKLADWMGEFTYPGKPIVMEVDWIGYTPMGQTCEFRSSVVCTEGWGE